MNDIFPALSSSLAEHAACHFLESTEYRRLAGQPGPPRHSPITVYLRELARFSETALESCWPVEDMSPTRRWPFFGWWLAFAGVQVLGYIVPRYANLHYNLTPLLLGVFVLLPGSLVAFVLPGSTPTIIQCALISGVNLIVWYGFWRACRTAASDKRSPRVR